MGLQGLGVMVFLIDFLLEDLCFPKKACMVLDVKKITVVSPRFFNFTFEPELNMASVDFR